MAYVQPTVLVAPQMALVNTAPAMRMPADHWQTTCSDCCGQPGGCGRCCYVACCASCAFGKVAASLPPGSACCAGNECGACCAYASVGGLFYAAGALFAGLGGLAMGPVIGVFTCCMHAPMRKALKKQYGIAQQENDCCITWFCDPCALMQELREIDIRKQGAMVPAGVMMQPNPMMMQQPMMAQPGMMQPGMVMQPGMMPMQPMQPQMVQPQYVAPAGYK